MSKPAAERKAAPRAGRPRAAAVRAGAAVSPGAASRAGAAPRAARQQAVNDARRAHVLAAAREAFLECGLEGASMREIAHRAGYTPGALYSYFASKEEVYAALLAESLQRLQAGIAVAQAGAPPGDAALRLRAAALAFFRFYREHPRDLDLGFYLFGGLAPRGLGRPLDASLNAALRAALQPLQVALEALGLSPREAVAETTALFAHAVGLLLLSHTGRIRMFRLGAPALFEAYLQRLVERAAATVTVPGE